MGNAPKIDLVALPRGGDLAALFDQVPDARTDAPAWAAMIEAGEAQALCLVRDGERIGALIWGHQEDRDGLALVIHAAQVAPQSDCDMTATIDQVFEFLARNAGAVRLRFWTQRAGLWAKADRLGYRASYVMEREI